jgi:hypothetical protein
MSLTCAVSALADAPDPIPAATDGYITPHADGSRTLTVWGGTNADTNPGWQWTTHGSDCNTDRAGAGFAIVWNDPTNPGNLIDGGNLGDFFVGLTNLNDADNVVHPTPIETIPGATEVDSSDYTKWRGGCGINKDHTNVVLPNGQIKSGKWNQGTWGPISHTYPASVTGPLTICPVMYDVHGSDQNTAPNGAKEIIAGGTNHNGDNSIQSNGSTPQGNGCFT